MRISESNISEFGAVELDRRASAKAPRPKMDVFEQIGCYAWNMPSRRTNPPTKEELAKLWDKLPPERRRLIELANKANQAEKKKLSIDEVNAEVHRIRYGQ